MLFTIILKNFTSLLSLNNKVTQALKNKYTQILNLKLEHFASKQFVSKIDVKGFLAHDIEDQVVLFDEGEKIAEYWKNVQFIATKGLGHKLHDDNLYRELYKFLFETDYIHK